MRTLDLNAQALRRGFEICPDLVCMVDLDGQFLSVNPSFERFFGYSSTELAHRSYLELIHPGDHRRATDEMARLGSGLESRGLELRMIDRDRKPQWISWRAAPIPEHDCLIAIGREIDKRRHSTASESLRTREAQRALEVLADNLPGMVYRCRNDANWSMEIVSPRSAELTGYEPSDLIGNRTVSYASLIEPEDRERVRLTVERDLREHRRFNLRYRIRTASGDVKTIWEQGCGVFDSMGNVRFLEGYITDVSAEEETRRRLHERSLLLDAANDAIRVTSMDGVITYWNAAAEKLWRWTSEEACGCHVTDLLFRDRLDVYEAALDATARKGHWEGEFEQRDRFGNRIIAYARWTLIRNDDGTPRSILSIVSDRSEQHKLETQLLRAQRLESIGTLASGMAHDLNNALSPILMGLQMLRRRCPGSLSRTLDLMESSVTRGATLIRHVLVFARGADKNPEPLGVASVIAEIRGILAQTFPKHIRTQFDVPDALPNVWADPTQIQQALMNLYVNARDAMPEGGTLTTSVSTVTVDRTYARLQANARPGTYIRVEVSDTGLGIAQELLGQVFDPFFTTKPTGQGTGLGLSILASIVRDHDGFVNAYSEIGRGTTFSIYLPVHAQTESVNPDVSPPESPVTRRNAQAGTTILFVDDEVSIREIGRDVLESHGYRVVLAGNGQEAVERFTQERVDAVIMDWAMPVMNGGEAIQAIRRQNPDAFIIACSGLMDRGALDRMNLDRPIEFLRKPYTEEQLLDRLASTPLATAPRSGN